MAIDVQSDLTDFYQFVGNQLKNDPKANLSPEQALALWRHQQEEIEAIREGLKAVDEGRTMSVEEHFEKILDRHPALKDV